MQLILESDTNIDPKIIMSTLEDTLKGNIAANGIMGELNKDACNGYKGSIQTENDISANEENMCIESEKIEDEVLLKSPIGIHNEVDDVAPESYDKLIRLINQEEIVKRDALKQSFEENGTLTSEQGGGNSTTTNDQIIESLEVNKLQNVNTSTREVGNDFSRKQHIEDESKDKKDCSYLEKDELTLLKEELAHILAEEKSKACTQESNIHKKPENVNIDANDQINEEVVSDKKDTNKENACTEEEINEVSSSVSDAITVDGTNNKFVAVDALIFDTDSLNDEGSKYDVCSSSEIAVSENKKNIITKEVETTDVNIQPSNKENSVDNTILNKTAFSEETVMTIVNNEPIGENDCSNKTAKCKGITEIIPKNADVSSANIQTSNDKEILSDNSSTSKTVHCENITEETKVLTSNIKENLDENNVVKTDSDDITKTFPTCQRMSTVNNDPSRYRENVEEINSSNKTVHCKDIIEKNKKAESKSSDKENNSSPNKNIDSNDTKKIIPTIVEDVDMTPVNISPLNNKESLGVNDASNKIADCQNIIESTDVEMASLDILPSNNKDSAGETGSSNKTEAFEDLMEQTDVEMTTVEIQSSNGKDNVDVTVSASKQNIIKTTDIEMTAVDNQTSNNKECVDDHIALKKTASCEDINAKISSNNKESIDNNSLIKTTDCDNVTEVSPINVVQDTISIDSKEDIMNVDENKDVEEVQTKIIELKKSEETLPEKPVVKPSPVICKLSNTLDILSDDDEDPPKEIQDKPDAPPANKHCINIDDDDDIMFIEDTNSADSKRETKKTELENDHMDCLSKSDGKKIDLETGEEKLSCKETTEIISDFIIDKDSKQPDIEILEPDKQIQISENTLENKSENVECKKPLLPNNFLKSAKKNLADMTRDDLEEFCILKIVESIVDRSNLSDIKTQLKNMAQSIDEYRKKAMMLSKQNRDLQVVLKSIQEEQKKSPNAPITPLKITRSVGMQVLMTEKPTVRRKLSNGPQPAQNAPPTNTIITRQMRNPTAPNPRLQKQAGNSQNIPVPRLVPASSPVMKPPTTPPVSSVAKASSPVVANGQKNSSGPKGAEKRPHNRVQSVTVDLTDDEPPAKMNARNSPAPPVRLVPSQNLLAPQRQPFGQSVNSPRKVYIPISGPQGQNIRSTIMLKNVSAGARQRCPTPQMPKIQQSQGRVNRIHGNRHPAPLPDAMKQYQPPTWKALPPAPDLKLSKVENGIVISWKIEGYQEDSYEEIASYQLYAYQETSSPPNTALWKKIGDVKALPLPMACTLTQFMAGFKYYFAVRAVDIRSRLGPFSLPGSILLLNKM